MEGQSPRVFGCALLAALGLLACSAAAQSKGMYAPGETGADRAGTNGWTMAVTANYSAVANRRISFNGASGNSGAQSANATISGAIRLNQDWFVPLSLASRNVFLGTVEGAPIPDQIHTLGLNPGLGYRFNDQWTLAASLGPRLYRLDNLEGSDFGIGGTVRATYRWRPDLMLAFGVAFEPDRDVPVLPAAGLRWDIRTNLTFSLMFPRSGLDYRVTRRLSLFFGGDGNFAVFRSDNNLGDKLGQPQYDHALATYRDFRLGAGAEYRLVRGLSATVEGGYSFGREIDYQQLDETVKFGSAPFLQAGLRCRF